MGDWTNGVAIFAVVRVRKTSNDSQFRVATIGNFLHRDQMKSVGLIDFSFSDISISGPGDLSLQYQSGSGDLAAFGTRRGCPLPCA
jgi:hypothetical protein